MSSEDFVSGLFILASVIVILLGLCSALDKGSPRYIGVAVAIFSTVALAAGFAKDYYAQKQLHFAIQNAKPRSLDNREWQTLRDGLAAVKDKGLIIFEWNGFDSETDLFAKRILAAMKAGYAPDKIQDAGLDSNMHFPEGVTATVNDDETGRMIGDAFVKAGLVKDVIKNAKASNTQVAYIKVGPKPFIPTPN